MSVQVEEVEDLLQGRPKPWRWNRMANQERLDYIATRMLAEDRKSRGVTRHNEMREEGILSKSQKDRRHRREVYSYDSVALYELTSLSYEQFWNGVFGRSYRRSERQRQPWWGGDPVAFLGEEEED